MTPLPAVFAWICLGCVPPPEVRVTEGVDARAFRRFLVPPFSDDRGLGVRYALEFSGGLRDMDFDVVGEEQAAAGFAALGMRKGEAPGMNDLLELRKLTGADAAVIGNVDCGSPGKGRVSVLVLDTAKGETAVQADYRPRSCGSRAEAATVMREVLDALGRVLGARRRRTLEEDGFR